MCYMICIIKKGDIISIWQVRKPKRTGVNLPNIIWMENRKIEIQTEGAQNMPPPNTPLGHTDSFELKAHKKQQMQE